MTEGGCFPGSDDGRGACSPVCAFVLGSRDARWQAPGCETEHLSFSQLALKLAAEAERVLPLHCHGAATARRLGIRRFPGRDVLDLFAFARPAAFCLPTPAGLAAALGLSRPQSAEEEIRVLHDAVADLLREIADAGDDRQSKTRAIAVAMATGGWSWGPVVLQALDVTVGEPGRPGVMAGLEVWHELSEWAERAPEPAPGDQPVSREEARAQLAELLPTVAENRPEQSHYAAELTPAFAPRLAQDQPKVVLAEAGTGVGKTVGYVAPASVWAEKNRGTVWLSTFTRNLQRQIDQELDRLYDDPVEKARKIVLRKGRENYLCLLNFDEAVSVARIRREEAVNLGLIARWLLATRDGAVVAGDLPGWLADRIGRGRVDALTDHRGECVYAACRHYSRCFVEHSARKARRARIVIANHALVMTQTALDSISPADPHAPNRFVFDEGHHLFNAADSAFSACLSGQETADLRRWLRGDSAASGRTARVRGLKSRIGDLIIDDATLVEALDEAMGHAVQLPATGWLQRLRDGNPQGKTEQFLASIRDQVYSRSTARDSVYGLEIEFRPVPEELLQRVLVLDAVLADIARPLNRMRKGLKDLLDVEAKTLDTATRHRIEGAGRSILRRALAPLADWRGMLEALAGGPPDDFVDWFSVERQFGRDTDVGMKRHWIDPMKPFGDVLADQAHGLVVTSATLTDRNAASEIDWDFAERSSGANHMNGSLTRVAVSSPFDYSAQTRIFVVSDVDGNDADHVAAAYRELFLAAGGGGLGLFTAIARLRATHERLSASLEDAGIPLFAQHVDGFDVATLVDLFRAERNACLLGTDAVRDGVDVPGDALRLIVFDRVPWPRPDLLHKARRARFGGGAWDDLQTRLKLKQAFGRLIRRRDDHGVFVMLDSRLPMRLATAFPPGVDLQRVGLADAVAGTRAFLAD